MTENIETAAPIKRPLDDSIVKKIRLLLMDCDGVLTDGRLYFSERGEELKVFNVRDGQGIADWHRAGFESGIISGRDAGAIIAKRAEELGIRFVKVKSADKCADFYSILKDANVDPKDVAFIGDDLGDIAVMRLVGLPVAVADADRAVKECAVYITHTPGGGGAVREVTDMLLKARQLLPDE